MNLKHIIFAVIVSLGTLSFTDTADARSKKYRHYQGRSYHHGHNHHYYGRNYGRQYRTYRYYPRSYYYDPYYYPRRSQFYLRVGPLTYRRW